MSKAYFNSPHQIMSTSGTGAQNISVTPAFEFGNHRPAKSQPEKQSQTPEQSLPTIQNPES